MERWAMIAGHPHYEVSDLGQVRSIERVIEQRSRWGIQHRRMLGKLLSPVPFRNGYMGLVLGRKSKCHLVHRLVAAAFIPGDASLQVNHKNGNRADNRAVNLEWMTCSDNHRHSYRELSRKQHVWTRPVIVGTQRFDSVLAASKALGVCAGSVSSAVRRGHRCRGHEVFYV